MTTARRLAEELACRAACCNGPDNPMAQAWHLEQAIATALREARAAERERMALAIAREAEDVAHAVSIIRALGDEEAGQPPFDIDAARERRDLDGAVTVERATDGPGAAVDIGIDGPPRPRRKP